MNVCWNIDNAFIMLIDVYKKQYWEGVRTQGEGNNLGWEQHGWVTWIKRYI